MKLQQEDWHAVSDAANDLREVEMALRLTSKPIVTEDSPAPARPENKDEPLAAIPPTDIEIPHHVNEVMSLLRMGDEELVEKMFPDMSELPQAEV